MTDEWCIWVNHWSRYYPSISFMKLKKYTKYLTQNSHCSNLHSDWTQQKYQSNTNPLSQCISDLKWQIKENHYTLNARRQTWFLQFYVPGWIVHSLWPGMLLVNSIHLKIVLTDSHMWTSHFASCVINLHAQFHPWWSWSTVITWNCNHTHATITTRYWSDNSTMNICSCLLHNAGRAQD
jgi:hypothetical protein